MTLLSEVLEMFSVFGEAHCIFGPTQTRQIQLPSMFLPVPFPLKTLTFDAVLPQTSTPS